MLDLPFPNEIDVRQHIKNQIDEIKQNRLTSMSLYWRELSELPSMLSELVWLEELDLVNSQIKDISLLSNLNKIKKLSLVNNNIIDIFSLSSLVDLLELHIVSNEVSDIKPLRSLVNLSRLYLIGNEVFDITPLANLNQLTELHLVDNKINDISSLSNLKKLTNLYLVGNKISDLSPLSDLKRLRYLYLGNNPICSLRPLVPALAEGLTIDIDWVPNESRASIVGCPIQDPPLDIIRQPNSNAAILRFFELTADGDTQPIHEAKLIIVGEPGAGKTTLLNKLRDPNYPVPDLDQDSTLGIDVHEGWSFRLPSQPEIEFRANIWDFGGQKSQHMTHQFFLTPSALYVLVADDRAQLTRFPYWFKIINLLGQERGYPSPVLVVLNQKNHSKISNFDLAAYQKHYPDLHIEMCIVDFAEKDPSRLNQLKAAIQTNLPTLRHVGDQLPRAWLQIRLQLREMAKTANHITFAQFQTVCVAEGVTHEQDQLLVSHYLHRLGTLLHFQQDPSLRDFIVLNPTWVVDAVYSVLKDERVFEQGGQFHRTDLEAIWQPSYTFVEQGKLLSLMSQANFEICYPTEPEAETYIAPQFLPSIQPDYTWPEEGCLKFRFQYAFMPEGVITRLIVRLHGLIQDKKVWQKGVLLVDKACQAQVIEEENNQNGLRVIDIAVTGLADKQKYLLHTVRNEIEKIHQKWFSNIKVDQMVPCDCDECARATEPQFYEQAKLDKFLKKGTDQRIQCHQSGEHVPVRRLLEGVFVPEELSPKDKAPAIPPTSSPEAVVNSTEITERRLDPAVLGGIGNGGSGNNIVVNVSSPTAAPVTQQ